MTFQTFLNDNNNRGRMSEKEFKKALYSIWLGMRDSNPRSWDQNPVPYRLANPQYKGKLY
jgi:hypothetical protein